MTRTALNTLTALLLCAHALAAEAPSRAEKPADIPEGKRIPKRIEQLLNPIVYRFNFTSRYKVGTVSELIEQSKAKTKEDWERYYYEHGRSEEELDAIGAQLYQKILVFREITLEDCQRCIKQYVIDNTWEGIYLREHNTIDRLQKQHGIAGFQKTDGHTDAVFAVDWERTFAGGKKIGLQIKPKSYRGHYLANVRSQNEAKQARYGGPVLTVIADKNGRVINTEIIAKIKAEMVRVGGALPDAPE